MSAGINEELIERLSYAGQAVCLAVKPGYQQFPPRCTKAFGHSSKQHESTTRSDTPPEVWEDEE